MAVNTEYKVDDIKAWETYKRTRSNSDREVLLKRFENLIQAQVNRWAGPVPREVLYNEAKLLAAKALDTYDATRGAALATHITNNLAPLSRVVYTAQNTTRLPENIILQLHTFNVAKDYLTNQHGREPSYGELHQELGMPLRQIERLVDYQRRNLIESGGAVNADSFASDVEDRDADVLSAAYHDLLPDEKTLFDWVTGGVHAGTSLSNPEILKKTGWTQAQLSYKKTLLHQKLDKMMHQGRSGEVV